MPRLPSRRFRLPLTHFFARRSPRLLTPISISKLRLSPSLATTPAIADGKEEWGANKVKNIVKNQNYAGLAT